MSDDQKDHSMSDEESETEDIALNSDEEVKFLFFITVNKFPKPGPTIMKRLCLLIRSLD